LWDTHEHLLRDLAATGLQLADWDFWPCSGPVKTTAGGHDVTVMPAAELAVAAVTNGTATSQT
jgi:hypothetical protein